MNIISVISTNVIINALILFGSGFCGFISYMTSAAVITEYAPVDAR